MAKSTDDMTKLFAAVLKDAAPRGFTAEVVSFSTVPTLPGVLALDKRDALSRPLYAGLIPPLVWDLTNEEALLHYMTVPYESGHFHRLLADGFLHLADKRDRDDTTDRGSVTLFLLLETSSSVLQEDFERFRGDNDSGKLIAARGPGFYRPDLRLTLDFYVVIMDQLLPEQRDSLRAFFALPGLPWLAGPNKPARGGDPNVS